MEEMDKNSLNQHSPRSSSSPINQPPEPPPPPSPPDPTINFTQSENPQNSRTEPNKQQQLQGSGSNQEASIPTSYRENLIQ